LDLSKYIDKTIRVKFQGGREGEASPLTNEKEIVKGSTEEGINLGVSALFVWLFFFLVDLGFGLRASHMQRRCCTA
jgi:hypothetical protein